jgi:hypothetical protein
LLSLLGLILDSHPLASAYQVAGIICVYHCAQLKSFKTSQQVLIFHYTHSYWQVSEESGNVAARSRVVSSVAG